MRTETAMMSACTGSLNTSLPARLYTYMYYISTALFIIIFKFNPLHAGNPNLCVGEQRQL